jgi:tetratricopeptide (TPR) repeat protein
LKSGVNANDSDVVRAGRGREKETTVTDTNEQQYWALLARYQVQLAQARADGNALAEHMALLALGECHFHLGQWLEVREHLTPALSWLGEHGFWMHEIDYLGSLAYACLLDDQTELALEHFTALCVVAQTRRITFRAAQGHLGRSRCLSRLSRYEEAARACREGLALCSSPADVVADARRQLLLQIGFILGHLGRSQEAVGYLEEGLALARAQGESDDEAQILATLGVTLLGMPGGDQRGIDRLREALALFEQLGDLREQAKTLADLGTAHLQHRAHSQRGIEEGLRYLAEGLRLARAVDDRELLGSILETQGRLHERQGRHDAALAAFQRAAALDPHSQPVERLHRIGRIYQQLGQSESALEYDTKALMKALALGDVDAEIEQLIHIADTHLQRGSFEQSCAFLEKAIQLSLSSDDDALTGGLHIRLAQLLYHRQEKQPVRALALWRIGILYAQQQAAGPARFQASLVSLIHPVKELMEVLGKRAFLALWGLSEPVYQCLAAQETYTRTFARVASNPRLADPFAFLDVEPLIAYLAHIDTQRLREWISEASRLPTSGLSSDERWGEAFEQFFLGLAAEERPAWEEAHEHFAQAAALAPSFAEPHIRRGLLLAEELDPEAIGELTLAIELAPDSWQAFFARGYAYSQLYESERALADYSQALALNRSAAACRCARAATYLEVGEAERAMLDSAKLTSEYPFYQEAWLLYGRARLAMGQYDQALYTFTDMIELRGFEDRGDIYYYRGLAWLWLDNERKAKADFTRSWRAFDELKARIMLIWLAWGEKRPTGRAISSWEELVETYFTDWYADLLSLLLALVRGPGEEVLDEFDQLIGQEPRRFEALFWNGMAYAAFGKADEAAQMWEQALQLGMPPRLLAPLRWLEQEQPACWEVAKGLLDRYQEQLAGEKALSRND